MSKKEELSKETIEHLSKLALLELSEEEKEELSKQLGDILDYFAKLDDIDTNNVDPTTHPIEGLSNIFRKDEPWKSLSNEEATKNTKYKQNGYFKAPRILKK